MHKLQILPSQWVELEPEEKAFIIAAIQLRLDAEKKAARKLKKK